MKTTIAKLLAISFFLQCFCLIAQNYQENGLRPSLENAYAYNHSKNSGFTVPATSSLSAFRKAAKKNNIPARTVSGLSHMYTGYYVVAGVFGSKHNLQQFIAKLKNRNLNPKIATHPESDLNYVYLDYSPGWQKAIESCISKLDGNYLGELWIMNIAAGKSLPKAEVSTVEKDVNASPALSEGAFKAAAKQYNIPNRILPGFKGINNGYYVVSGVYSSESNARSFIKALGRKKLSAKSMLHPKSGLYYVYLAHYTDWKDAVKACNNDLDGHYKKEVWLMRVQDQKEALKTTATRPEVEPSKAKERLISQETFKELAKKNNIPNRTLSGFKDLNAGYYLVAGVFGNPENADKFMRTLGRKAIVAKNIMHPESKLHYVYLAHHENGEEAINACVSRINNTYDKEVWIMQVEKAAPKLNKAQETSANAPNANAQAGMMNLNTYRDIFSAPTKTNMGDPTSQNKLLAKADLYFQKMWYAEAAEIYETVLSKNDEYHSFEVIEKAADAHYFNTNMERAYYWYDLLYSKYRNEMSADNIFKYAHTLKGTGKYSRAKRLMRLYSKKVKQEENLPSLDDPTATPGEVVLDNILDTAQDFEIKNLAINSEYSEFSPMFHNENEVVFASAMDSSFFSTRRYKWNNQPYLDLYVAKINEESQEVRNAIKFSKKINTKYHEASVSFSPDNRTMYFTRNNYGKKLKRDKHGINHLKIYRSTKVDGEWTEAVEVPFNSDDYSTGHPALSPDGKQLYFVSDMPGTIGGTDIFVVDLLPNGEFSEPRNLGPEINTERKEMFPYINEKKLYFSSDGHVGLGGLDVYEAVLGEEGGFLEVKNVGQPVNSNKDDFSYIIDETTQKGFFASNRKGGKGDDDIYSFKRLLPEETNENAIAGVVTDLVTGEVMPEALVLLLDENNIKLKEMITGEDGSFVFEDLESTTQYTIKTVKGSYFEDEQIVTTRDNERVEVAVSLKKLEELIAIEDGIKKLKIDMIYFDFDKFNIRSDASEELDKLVEVMNEYPNMVIKIESHTDSRGKRAYNKYLSDKRAKSTRDYLISRGIDAGRIESAIGYGEERLLNECNGSVRCSSEKHQLNRRSEFIIVKM